MSTVFANFFVFIPDFFFQTFLGRKSAFSLPCCAALCMQKPPRRLSPTERFCLSQFSKIVPIETAYLRYAVCGCCLCIKNANCYGSDNARPALPPEGSLPETGRVSLYGGSRRKSLFRACRPYRNRCGWHWRYPRPCLRRRRRRRLPRRCLPVRTHPIRWSGHPWPARCSRRGW